MKKLMALLLAAAQLGVIAPSVMAAGTDAPNASYVHNSIIYSEEIPSEGEVPAADNTVVSYSSDDMYLSDGTQIPVDTAISVDELSRYGITANPSSVVWSVQRISSVNYAGVEGLRFSTRSPGSSTSNTVVKWDFNADTVNTPKAMTGDGYIYESEFMIQMKDTGVYTALNLNGKDESGNDVELGEIRFVLDGSAVKGSPNSASAYAVSANGAKIGNKLTIKATSDTNYDYCGELLFIRVKLDFVNNVFSAWLVPRKDEAGEYSAIEPTEENLLVENAPLYKTAAEFTGFSYDIKNYKYGNGVWINNVSVSEYTPDVIVATPTPTPRPTEGHEEGVALKIGVLSDTQYGRASQKSGVAALDYAGEKFKDAVTQVVEKAGGIEQLDVLMIPGDITHNSAASEYQAFVEDLNEVIPSGSHTKVIFLRGNHDAKSGMLDNFTTYLSEYDNTLTAANNVYDIYGYKFVMVSQDTNATNDESSNYIHSPETIAWFTDAVAKASAEAAAEGKPVFVGMHPDAKNTVYGSFPVTGMRNGEEYTSSYEGLCSKRNNG